MDQPNYKSKLKELQANIKRSKLEHRELEFEFQNLIIQRNDCDRSAMKAFLSKYNSGLEEDKRRVARNEKIKQMLERIDYQASALAAKTERLKMLKTHYEKNLYRAFGPNSSRTDNSPDRLTQKQRTKSVDAHTQIPRSNYELCDNVDDALNKRNYVSSIREPRSVSTSRINQMDYNSFPNYEQRSIRFNTDISVNREEIQKDLELSPPSQPANKGVRLFYGNELMNLPNLKVDNDTPKQDTNTTDQILRQAETIIERSLEETNNLNFDINSTSKPTYQANVDYQIVQSPNRQLVMKDLQMFECNNDVKNYPQHTEDNNQEKDSMKQTSYSQYHNNINTSTYNPTIKSSINHTTRSQYQDGNKNQEGLQNNKSVINTQSPYVEFHDNNNISAQNQPPKTIMRREPYSQYQDNGNKPSTCPSFTQNQVNNNTDIFIHNSPLINSVANVPYLRNTVGINQVPKQNQPVAKPSYPEPVHSLSCDAPTENLGDVSHNNNNNRPPNLFQQESVNRSELQNLQDNQFIPNTIPDIKPISSAQIDAGQINKPPSPKSHTKILEAPSINIPQGIHQVWEKVVDVEIVNHPPKPFSSESNEPRNDVIDKIYKEISSLGETPVDEEKDGINLSKIDDRAEIINKIEEHYYGEKVKFNENETDLYSTIDLNNENYEPCTEQSQIQVDQNIDYTSEAQMYQDPNTNYRNSNQNDIQQVQYNNYDINEQYYSQSQDPDLSERQDNYASHLAGDYSNDQLKNDPNYVYAQNENYQQFATDGGDETLYPVEPLAQNHIIEDQQQSQQYTDEMTNEYYEQQQPNEPPYAENVNELNQQYSSDFYSQNGNYSQQNLNPEEYQEQYNENTPEMYQEYSNDQLPQIESTIPYENTDYTLNEPQAISKPIEAPVFFEPEEISINQPSTLSSAEQITSPNVEASKSLDEIKPDTIVPLKPQIETKKKRVNFLDSSDSEQPSGEEKQITKLSEKEQSDSDFEFSVKSN